MQGYYETYQELEASAARQGSAYGQLPKALCRSFEKLKSELRREIGSLGLVGLQESDSLELYALLIDRIKASGADSGRCGEASHRIEESTRET